MNGFFSRNAILIGIAMLFLSPTWLNAQGVAQQAADMVDFFTGDLRYSTPLLNVPGPNGENFPLSLNYVSGVRVDQNASWVGLGWDLDIGEIRRSIKGVPDDFNGQVITTKDNEEFVRSTHFYGPMYFSQFPISNYESNNGTTSNFDMDIATYQSEDNNLFEQPAYDNYVVSVPGLSGELALHLFDYATLLQQRSKKEIDENKLKVYTTADPEYKPFSKKAQFRFKTLNSAGVQIADLKLVQTPAASPQDPSGHEWDCLTNTTVPPATNLQTFGISPVKLPSNTSFVGNLNATNQVKESMYVVYFTNAQILANSSNNLTDPDNPAAYGFLDVPGLVRPNNQLVGAFQITDANGFVYHFSLPIYAKSDFSSSYALTETLAANILKNTYYSNPNEYAVAWKLTAITGPDYKDYNANKIPDEGDVGFWITFEYGKWAEDFTTRYPQFGINPNLSSESTKRPRYEDKTYANLFNFSYEGSFSMQHEEVYYLNKVRTSTHTALFIKDYREDANSNLDLESTLTQNTIPSLYLRKVMLFNNADNASALFSVSNAHSNYFPNNVILWENYNTSNKNAINAASLQSSELDFDYSLCKRFLNNNKVNVNAAMDLDYSYPQESAISVSISNLPQSGKLTLKRIKTYYLHHDKITPTLDFDYSSFNPDYTILPQFRDNWGFYKSGSNISGTPIAGFLTGANKDDARAWSLTSILSPLGAKTEITYESDEYSTVYGNTFHFQGERITKPIRVFVRKNCVPSTNSTCDFIDDNVQGVNLNPYYNVEKSHFDYDYKNPSGVIARVQIGRCENNLGNSFVWNTIPVGYGGGLRVKKINIYDPNVPNGSNYELQINYDNGAVSYEPDKVSLFYKLFDPNVDCNLNQVSNCLACAHLTSVESPYVCSSTMVNRDYLLPPSVGYEFVTVKEVGANIGSMRYQFKNVPELKFYTPPGQEGYITDYVYPASGCGGVGWTGSVSYDPSGWVEHIHRSVELSEGYGIIGKPLRMETYDKHNLLVYAKSFEYKQACLFQEAFNSKFAFYWEQDVTTSPTRYMPLEIYPVPGSNKHYFFSQYVFPAPLAYVKGAFYDVATNKGAGATTTMHVAYSKIYANYILSKVEEFKDGLTTIQSFDNYDYLRGSYKSSTSNCKGSFVTSSTGFYNSGNIGAKADNLQNKNILNAINLEKAVPGNTIKSNWSNSQTIRYFNSASNEFQSGTYSNVWKQTGSELINTADLNLTRNLGKVTLFDRYFHPLENLSGDDNYSCVKYGYQDLYPIAKLDDGRFGEFTHSSAEDDWGANFMGGEVAREQATRLLASVANIKAHSGDYVLAVDGNKSGFSYYAKAKDVLGAEPALLRNKTYMVSVWIYNRNINSLNLSRPKIEVYAGSVLIGSSDVYYESAKDWSQVRLNFTIDALADENVVIKVVNNSSSTVYMDDFRLQPLGASVAGYVYDRFSGLVTYTLDKENFYTRFDYDNAGSVKAVFKETPQGEVKVSKSDYGFKRPLNF